MMAPVMRRPRPLSGATDLSDATARISTISTSDRAIEVDVCSHLNFRTCPTTQAQPTDVFV
jgi:hypothetical protein